MARPSTVGQKGKGKGGYWAAPVPEVVKEPEETFEWTAELKRDPKGITGIVRGMIARENGGYPVQSIRPSDKETQSAAAVYNAMVKGKILEVAGEEKIAWEKKEIRAGDVILSVNGQSEREAITQEFQNATELSISLRRVPFAEKPTENKPEKLFVTKR
eukprot:CAMPEP_0204274094 /NCGR_PEP_ID=MMETSP0468-20130131/24987_1 /ASSEMBLY_ACC=CAM_ASM_000383 /TAXON_ID=2969 /ORGANISM="Oxyrrhis marina" /LENGTH=158 /DNA_ID=CAMNT_0051250247 /DNA_START=50 /DNA_END=526 /DNA_ORIENTATION=+